MRRYIIIMLALLACAAPAAAQELTDHRIIASESRQTRLPGPAADETRGVYFWRPPNVQGALPVLYMADGLPGLKVAVSRLRSAIVEGRARPMMVVALEPSPPPRRMKEYVLGEDTREWDAHFSWLTNTVLPWAERNAGASTRASERGIGGVSNGADFAIAAATLRPDLFTRVLAHSPVNTPAWRAPGLDLKPPEGVRWAFTAGDQRDYEGRAEDIQEDLVQDIRAVAPLRRCQGAWGHDVDSWVDVSSGTIAWLFELATPGVADAPDERRACRNFEV